MARLRPAPPVKLFCRLLCGDADLLLRLRRILSRRFSPIDLAGDVRRLPADPALTAELGGDPLQQFVSFSSLIRLDDLPWIKNETQAIEAELAAQMEPLGVPRPASLDPGYVHADKLVVASARDGAARIYIGSRVYAEIALQRYEGTWCPPAGASGAYADPGTLDFFERVRAALSEAVAGGGADRAGAL